MRDRTKLVISALVALLALMSAAAVAGAETSSEKVYHLGAPGLESEGPGAEGTAKGHRKTVKKPKPDAPPADEGAEASTEPDAKEDGPAPTGPGGVIKPPSGGSGKHDPRVASPTQAPQGSDRRPIRDLNAGSDESASDRPSSEGGGGISSVVLILIAVSILAALSIGVTIYHERFRPGRR